MYGGDCDAAIVKAAAAVTDVQSQSQEVGSGDEGKGWACCVLICHQQKRTSGGSSSPVPTTTHGCPFSILRLNQNLVVAYYGIPPDFSCGVHSFV